MQRSALWLLLLLLGVGLASCSESVEPVRCFEANAPSAVAVNSRATPLHVNYLLSKPVPPPTLPLDTYRVELAIRFEPSGGVNRAFLTRYRDVFERCIAITQPKLRGPRGELLQIALTDGQGPGKSPVRVYVTDDEKVRGHHKLWLASWTCPSMIHEMFHLLGLVDEYPEVQKYPSRILGPLDSIMSNPDLALGTVLPMRSLHDCVCSDPACEAEIPRYVAEARAECPAGAQHFTHQKPYPQWLLADVRTVEREQSFLATAPAGTYRFIGVTELLRPSLLYPAQFEAIVRPGCGVSSQYAACASRSYAEEPLGPAPEFCSGMAWLF